MPAPAASSIRTAVITRPNACAIQYYRTIPPTTARHRTLSHRTCSVSSWHLNHLPLFRLFLMKIISIIKEKNIAVISFHYTFHISHKIG